MYNAQMDERTPNSITLKTISGFQCQLAPPYTLEHLLSVVEAEFQFTPESVKVLYRGKLTRVVEVLKAGTDAPHVFASSNVGRAATPLRTQKQEGNPSPLLGSSVPTATTAAASQDGGSMIVFGVPQHIHKSVQDNAAVARAARVQNHTAAPTSLRDALILGNHSPFPGSLPYPHCPDGLNALTVIALEYENRMGGGRHYDGFCRELFDHPTMQYIIREVTRDAGMLAALLKQIKVAMPELYQWIERHPKQFVRMLNRSLPTAEERNRDALLSLTQQLSLEMLGGKRSFTVQLGDQDDEGAGAGLQIQVLIQVGDTLGSPDGVDGADDDDGESDESMWSSVLEFEIVPDGAMDDEDYGEEVATTSISTPREGSSLLEEEEEGEELLEGGGGELHSTSYHSGSHGDSDSAYQSEELAADAATTPSMPEPEDAAAGEMRRSPYPQTLADPIYAELAARVAHVSIQARQYSEATPSSSAATHLLTEVHAEFQRISVTLMTELESNLMRVANETYFEWLVATAGSFFANAEEFYVQVIERGMAAALAGGARDPLQSAPAFACIVALSKQLYCEAVRLIERGAQMAALTRGVATNTWEGPPEHRERRRSSRSWMRVGALRNLPADCSPLVHPCARWITADGPRALVRDLLAMAHDQGASVVWYCSHYHHKREGKTLQSVAYVFDGAAERVHATRLLFNSKVHKEDEVLPLLQLIRTCGEDAVPADLRSDWVMLMHRLYRTLVKPIEALLPLSNTTATPLYVVDTRHEPAPKHACDAWTSQRHWQASWFAGYCDDNNMLCADKWCLATSLTPWNVVLAAEASICGDAQRGPRAILTSPNPTSDAPEWLTEDLQRRLRFQQYPLSGLFPQHAVILHESIGDSSSNPTPAEAGATRPSSLSISHNGLTPSLVGDLHVVDNCDPLSGEGRCDAVTPYHATLCRVHALPWCDEVLRALYEGIVVSPSTPLVAVLRTAILGAVRRHNAPWLTVGHTVMDYGDKVASLWPLLSRAGLSETPSEPVAAASPVEAPAPVKREAPVSRKAMAVSEAQQYAETHGIGDVYELMLQRILEARPENEEAVLTTLINYLETSKGELDRAVSIRKAASE